MSTTLPRCAMSQHLSLYKEQCHEMRKRALAHVMPSVRTHATRATHAASSLACVCAACVATQKSAKHEVDRRIFVACRFDLRSRLRSLLRTANMPNDGNLFAAHSFYVNDVYRQRVSELQSASWVDATSNHTLARMANMGSAFWIDRIGKIRGDGVTLERVFSDAESQNPPPLVVAVLYNLPNRDCHALASNGELCCEYAPDGTCQYAAADESCTDGLDRYKREYVDPFVSVLVQHSSVPAAIILEPDSMANLATNTDDFKCGNRATQSAYVNGIRHAIDTLHARAPHASLYLDAAHGGWLGWPDKADEYLKAVERLGDAASYLRGFAVNVANYQGLGVPCPAAAFAENWPQLGQQFCAQHHSHECCDDPCGLFRSYNSGNNEHNWVLLLSARLARSPLHSRMPAPHFVIDSGRNGHVGMRNDCANWCNVRGAGIGHEPSSDTLLPDLIDAYYWLKTPGESDGCTETLPSGSACARFDGMCGSADSVGSVHGEPRAPEAGEWFVPHVAELICRAQLDSAHGERNDGGDDGRCTGTVQRAVEVTEEKQATVDSPPPPPRYEFRRPPPPGHTLPPPPKLEPTIWGSTSGVAVAQSAEYQCNDLSSSSSDLVPTMFILCLACFVAWFIYPRVEPWLRRKVGDSRYEAYRRDVERVGSYLTRATRLVADGAARLWARVERARMAGVQQQLETDTEPRSRGVTSLPTVEDDEL